MNPMYSPGQCYQRAEKMAKYVFTAVEKSVDFKGECHEIIDPFKKL